MADRPTTSQLVAAERAAQGLPRRVEDPAVLERIATLLEPRDPLTSSPTPVEARD